MRNARREKGGCVGFSVVLGRGCGGNRPLTVPDASRTPRTHTLSLNAVCVCVSLSLSLCQEPALSPSTQNSVSLGTRPDWDQHRPLLPRSAPGQFPPCFSSFSLFYFSFSPSLPLFPSSFLHSYHFKASACSSGSDVQSILSFIFFSPSLYLENIFHQLWIRLSSSLSASLFWNIHIPLSLSSLTLALAAIALPHHSYKRVS